MASGPESGNSVLIESFDVQRKLFFLENDFASSIVGHNYKIEINRETFFKTKQGATYPDPIQILEGGGILNRLESTKIFLKMRIPKFALSSGSFLFDLNMRYNSLEEE